MLLGWRAFLALLLFDFQRTAMTHALINASLTKKQQQDVHLIVLVHGWMGTPEEMSYLAGALDRQATSLRLQRGGDDSTHPTILVHSAECNRDRTYDGIAAGGSRLAAEVNDMLRDFRAKNQTVSLSIVGNSLGGLYARYALASIDFGAHHENAADNECAASWSVRPAVFCTTATPHLGVSQHTYVPLPRAAEFVIASTLPQQTLRDLFRFSKVIQDLTLSQHFVSPLMRFEQRLAHANAHQTDFQVPTATAAFVDPNSQSLHYVPTSEQQHRSTPSQTEDPKAGQFWRLTVDTAKQSELSMTSTDASAKVSDDATINSTVMAQQLDAMGWRKIFWDVRDTIPAIPLPSFSFLGGGGTRDSAPNGDPKQRYTSSELYRQFTSTDRLAFPMGHTMLVANSKSAWYARVNAGGKPVMDFVAKDLLQYIWQHD